MFFNVYLLNVSFVLIFLVTVMKGMCVFLDNKILEARKVFATQSFRNPYYLLGVSAIECLAAALSLEMNAIDKVRHACSRALVVVQIFRAPLKFAPNNTPTG